MKKALFLSSLLLLGLTTTGCVKQPQQNLPSSTAPITHNETVAIPSSLPTSPQVYEERQIENDAPMHQLKSVQNSMIFIQEKSNGFEFPQYQNQIVLLQIFGKECEYCFEEMPYVEQISQRYHRALQVLGLQAQPVMSPETAQTIIRNFQIDYPIIDRDEAGGLLKFISNTYGWNGILPYFLLIKDGVTEYSFSGRLDKKEFEDAIQSLM